MSEYEKTLRQVEAADILRRMDNFMLQVHSIYDVGKVTPHPYDAVGNMAKSLLHDYANFAFTVRNFIKETEGVDDE